MPSREAAATARTQQHAPPDGQPARERTRPPAEGGPQTWEGGRAVPLASATSGALNWAPANCQATHHRRCPPRVGGDPIKTLCGALNWAPSAGRRHPPRRPHRRAPIKHPLRPLTRPSRRATRTAGTGPTGTSTQQQQPTHPIPCWGPNQPPADQRARAATPQPPHTPTQPPPEAHQQTHLVWSARGHKTAAASQLRQSRHKQSRPAGAGQAAQAPEHGRAGEEGGPAERGDERREHKHDEDGTGK